MKAGEGMKALPTRSLMGSLLFRPVDGTPKSEFSKKNLLAVLNIRQFKQSGVDLDFTMIETPS